MDEEAVLVEAVTLAEEIIENGSGEGRGLQLASLVLRLHDAMQKGRTPLSWNPQVPLSEVLSSLPPPPANPSGMTIEDDLLLDFDLSPKEPS